LLFAWTEHIGQDASVSFRWDRTGLQSLSVTRLMHGELWTPAMVAGKFGHVSLATTSTKLPNGIQELGFTYRTLDNGRFSLDLDPITVMLPASVPHASRSFVDGIDGKNGSYGVIDPLSIGWSIYSIGSALYQLLTPQIDVGLGGTVEFTAAMNGPDKLVLQFRECPSIHVAAWFRFDLDVQQVDLSPGNVRVTFKPQPQNWLRIQSRDFPVNDQE
jgi:hypothetical protein